MRWSIQREPPNNETDAGCHPASPFLADMTSRNQTIVAIGVILAIVAISTISIMGLEGDPASADPNDVEYTIKDYSTGGNGDTYKLEVKGYAASVDQGTTFQYSADPTWFVAKNGGFRVAVIYGPAAGSADMNAMPYMIQYQLMVGTDGETPYFSVVTNTVKCVDVSNGQMTVIGASDIDQTRLATAIIPATFTFTIPADADLSGVTTSAPTPFKGKATEYVSNTVIIGGTKCLKTVIILGDPYAGTTTNSVVNMSTVKTLVFGGSPKKDTSSMAALDGAKSVENIYFDGECGLLSNTKIRIGGEFNIYLTSNADTVLYNNFGATRDAQANLYFSRDSVMPKTYGNETTTKTAVTFYIHSSSGYWTSYLNNGKLTADEMGASSGTPIVYGYPLQGLTISESTGGSLVAEAKYAPEGYAVSGCKVVVTPTPESGYVLQKISYSCNGIDNVVSADDDGVYSFTMPDGAVTISATFAVQTSGPKLSTTHTVDGSAIDISLSISGSPDDAEIPDKIYVYVKYNATEEAYSFSKITVTLPSYVDSYTASVGTSMSSLEPVEYLVQVFSGETLLDSTVVVLNG